MFNMTAQVIEDPTKPGERHPAVKITTSDGLSYVVASAIAKNLGHTLVDIATSAEWQAALCNVRAAEGQDDEVETQALLQQISNAREVQLGNYRRRATT